MLSVRVLCHRKQIKPEEGWEYLLYHNVKALVQDLIVIVACNEKFNEFLKELYESVTKKSGKVSNLT